MRKFLMVSLVLVSSAYFLASIIAFAQEIVCVERQACERMLAELEAQIDREEAKLAEIGKQKITLQSEVNSLNSKINKINLQIRAINLNLSKLDKEIATTKVEISGAESKLEINKTALANLIQKMYEDERRNLVEILLKAPRLSDFFGNLNNILSIQDTLAITVQEISELRNDLVEKKEGLALKRSDTAALRAAQDAQKAAADLIKKEKGNLLTQTKGQESMFQALLKETRKTAAQIRNRLFEFIGGGSLTFEKAYDFAKVAERATAMRAAMILAVLDRESALGRNVGQCDYQTAMNPTRDKPFFLTLLRELKAIGKHPPDPVKVSCPIVSDGAYGGAMGPAQFIPSTWAIYAGYSETPKGSGNWIRNSEKDRIGQVTGSNPPNPWSHGDAFVATGLYLADAYNSSSCRNYAEENKISLPYEFLRERCAAAKYYAGGNWYKYRFLYGDPVVKKAQQLQADIDTLNS